MSITDKSGSFALDVISREQQNITRQAAIIRLAQESIAKSEARIKLWASPGVKAVQTFACQCCNSYTCNGECGND